MSESIPAVLRSDPNSYMPILIRKGIPLSDRNKSEVTKILQWLQAQRQAGLFNNIPDDPTEKAHFIESVKKQYKQQVYGSVMMLVIGIVIKIIISLIIDHYFA